MVIQYFSLWHGTGTWGLHGVCNVFAHSGSELSTMLCFLMVGIIIIKMIVSVKGGESAMHFLDINY